MGEIPDSMKRNKIEILDPEADDFCAILAEAIRKHAKEIDDGKGKRARAKHSGSSRPPPDKALPSAVG